VTRSDSCWAVILAAGDGTRLAPLTNALYGYGLPKQFAAIDGRRSLLQTTVDRVGRLIPARRTVVVVGEPHESLARSQLAGHPAIEIVVQPKNMGTGPGVLLPLARIMARDPRAQVAIFPSDHHIPNPGPFLEAVEEALGLARAHPDLITLLGVVPDRAETDYGWILPGEDLPDSGRPGFRLVRKFVEKPAARTAQWLLAHHALWNTFTLVGQLRAYWGLARAHLPRHAQLFERYARTIGQADERMAVRWLYDRLAPADFSRSVLGAAQGLATVAVGDSGWCDWGRPDRVMRSLAGTPSAGRLLERMQHARP
jgi:mannose-1-phosphate guanylyltransferase